MERTAWAMAKQLVTVTDFDPVMGTFETRTMEMKDDVKKVERGLAPLKAGDNVVALGHIPMSRDHGKGKGVTVRVIKNGTPGRVTGFSAEKVWVTFQTGAGPFDCHCLPAQVVKVN